MSNTGTTIEVRDRESGNLLRVYAMDVAPEPALPTDVGILQSMVDILKSDVAREKARADNAERLLGDLVAFVKEIERQ